MPDIQFTPNTPPEVKEALTQIADAAQSANSNMHDTDNPQQLIEDEVLSVQQQQRELEELQLALSKNEQFTRFMELSKAVNDKMAEVRAHIEAVMVPAYQEGRVGKSLKGPWGSVTVVESDKFKIDEEQLPAKFFKKVVDESKVRQTYQLEGKAPKGCEPYKRYSIMMKLKQEND